MAAPTRRGRIQVLLWMLVVLGLPLAIVVQLAWGPADYGAPSGEQPGGQILVRIVDESGDAVVSHDVELQLWPVGSKPETYVTKATNDEGRVAFDAPPLTGKYRVLAGGGELQRVGRERSFVDGKGRAVELSEFELAVTPAAVVVITLTRSEALAPASGEVVLEGDVKGGALFGLLAAPISATKDFENGTVRFDGLPPFSGKALVLFKDGAQLRFTVDAPAGVTELAYEL